MKMLLAVLLFGILLIAGCSASKPVEKPAEPVEEKKEEPIQKPELPKEIIKLGFIGPLSGDAAAYGLQIQKSMLLAIKEINERGGVNGKNLELISEDGKCTSSDAATAAEKLIGQNIKVILRGVC